MLCAHQVPLEYYFSTKQDETNDPSTRGVPRTLFVDENKTQQTTYIRDRTTHPRDRTTHPRDRLGESQGNGHKQTHTNTPTHQHTQGNDEYYHLVGTAAGCRAPAAPPPGRQTSSPRTPLPACVFLFTQFWRSVIRRLVGWLVG